MNPGIKSAIRLWIAPLLVAILFSYALSVRPDRIDHNSSPAFTTALTSAINRLKRATIRPAAAAVPNAMQTVENDTYCDPCCIPTYCEDHWTCQLTCYRFTTCDCPTEEGYETCSPTWCWECDEPPVLDPVGDREVNAGETLVVQLAAKDPDTEDILTFFTDAEDVLPPSPVFDDSTGLFVWITTPGGAGVYSVTFGVTDGSLSDSETIVISVYYPPGNLPPVLSVIGDVVVFETEAVAITVNAGDPNGDPLVYSISDPRFEQDENVFSWRTDTGDAGTYHPVVYVTDGYVTDSAAVEVTVLEELPPESNHDPLTANVSEFYSWEENLITWNTPDDGYISVDTTALWRAAIVSGRSFKSSDSLSMMCRFYRGTNNNYMFGFTRTGPGETDYHYIHIDPGIYVHSSGSIRPIWDVNNGGYWSAAVPIGYYDCRIALNTTNGIVVFTLAQVDNYDDPTSDFSNPYWQSFEPRTIEESYYIQINPYNEFSCVYDVWSREGSGTVATVLQGFAARSDRFGILVEWTLSEYGGAPRFVISRSSDDGACETLPSDGIGRDGLSFSYRDTSCEPGKSYVYMVYVMDERGKVLLFETSPVSMPVAKLALNQNYPNPFNPTTTIGYFLPERCPVVIDIYDVSGALVTRLVEQEEAWGQHTVEWEGRDRLGNPVSSGVYFCKLVAGREKLSRKMVLLR